MLNPTANLAPDKQSGPTFVPLFVLQNFARLLEVTGAMTLAVQSELMSLEDAAAYRGCSPEHLGQMIKAGSLPSAPIYSGGHKKPVIVLVRKCDVDALPPVTHPNARKFRGKGKPAKPDESA